jgi:hypothetical protein
MAESGHPARAGERGVKALRRLARSFIAVALVAAAAGCGSSLGDLLRSHTYPPDFRYVSPDQLRSSMWVLGSETIELRGVLADPALSEATRRTRAELLLSGMETTVQKIGPQQWSSNHPEMKEALEALERDIHMARESVNHEPPNYFLAGSVSGGCLYCHAR